MNPKYFKDRWQLLLHRCWSAVEVGEACKPCNRLIETPDMYGTGDSPTDYECGAHDATDCPRKFEDPCDVGKIAEQIYEGK